MPPPNKQPKEKRQAVRVPQAAQYPPEAFEFIQEGLSYTVEKIHGPGTAPKTNRHVSGQQLCDGLRELALNHWGLLARTVLHRWNITSTLDFGRIVFSLIDIGSMQKTDNDTLVDFKDVFDFKTGFEAGYTIPSEFV